MTNFLFFMSGASSLIYQISWIRQSSLIFGSSIAAISVITAVFFGGLALGNYLIVRTKREFSVKLYAKLELAAGLFGALSVFFFAIAGNFGVSSGATGTLLQILITTLCIGAAVVAMGMGFPVMVGLSKANFAEKQIAGVYFINSLGAVFGAAFCGFILLKTIGISNSIFAAAGINVLIAVLALFYLKKPADKANLVHTDMRKDTACLVRPLPVILFAFVGFNGMLAELAASRFLTLIVTNTIYVYTLTISTTILGLALGAGLFGLISHKISQKINAFGAISLLWSATFSAVMFLIPVRFWFNLSQTQSIQSLLAISFFLSFLPALLSGALFPAAVKIYNSTAEKSAGILSSANTLGGIFGALLCGFVFLPILGLANTILVAVIISIIIGTIAILKYSEKKIIAIIIVIIMAIIAFAGQNNYKNFIRNYLQFGKRQTLIAYKEGREAVVSVLSGRGIKTMEIDRLWQGENRKTRQIMAAHIPMLISKDDPKNVLLIGFGTGLTASRFLYYDIEKLVGVDIEKSVFDFARSEFSADFLNDERVKILVEDGRNTIRRREQKFDIISVEIGQIFRPYLAGFYTKEFYENAAKILTENGILTQFVPIASFDFATMQSIIKTFLSVFENAQLWYNGSEFLLLGTKGEFGNLSSERVDAVLSQNERVVSDLMWSYWGGSLYLLSDKRVLAANFLSESRVLAYLASGGEIFSDDLPKLEYYSAANRQNEPFIDSIKGYLSPATFIIPEITSQEDIGGIHGIRTRNLGDIVASELYFAYTQHQFIVPGLLEKALEYNPLNLAALVELANIHYEKREFERAGELFERALRLDPQNSHLHRQFALILIQLDYKNLAIDNLLTALEISPNDFIAHTILAGLMLERQNYNLAARHVSFALNINPNYREALRMQEYLNNLFQMGAFE